MGRNTCLVLVLTQTACRVHCRGDALLLDAKSQIVYRDAGDWPEPVGVLSNGRLQVGREARQHAAR